VRSERFSDLVKQQPENALFRFSLGQALLDEDQPSKAVPHLEFCVNHRADWMVPRILLGKALVALDRIGEARPILENALLLAIDQHHETPEAELRALLGDLA
jgi:predicted Zn-dependent protease